MKNVPVGQVEHKITDEELNYFVDGGSWAYTWPQVFLALRELQERRNAEKEQGNTEHRASEEDGAEERTEAILPIPCTKGYEDCTVKEWFAKINEELDELKEIVIDSVGGLKGSAILMPEERYLIAEEAADTITAITSMLEAMCIDEEQRQAAQRQVNEKNRERGRF